ncbi:MAG: hypothetical protein Q9212_002325 [Teloschistes hypoglaucus]
MTSSKAKGLYLVTDPYPQYSVLESLEEDELGSALYGLRKRGMHAESMVHALLRFYGLQRSINPDRNPGVKHFDKILADYVHPADKAILNCVDKDELKMIVIGKDRNLPRDILLYLCKSGYPRTFSHDQFAQEIEALLLTKPRLDKSVHAMKQGYINRVLAWLSLPHSDEGLHLNDQYALDNMEQPSDVDEMIERLESYLDRYKEAKEARSSCKALLPSRE